MTNTLTIATKPGRISKGRRRGGGVARVQRGSTDVPLAVAVSARLSTPTDNYLSPAINCRHSDNADGLPGDEWKWRRAS